VDPALDQLVLHGDPLRVSQILLNLLGNAVKFTMAGGIVVRAKCIRQSQTDVLVGIEVTDTGIGIKPEQVSKLFAAFEQADNSTTRLFGGTGLGLYICKTLVERMGGDIGVNSVPGQGSTFWISLLFKKEENAQTPAATAPRDAFMATLEDLKHCRVLLVEDEPINQEVTSLLLENAGIRVDIASDGIAAVEQATANDYALILMDVSMPRMDGLEATQRIRQLPNRADTPIIAMTANAFVEDRARCLAAGMNDFLTKPAKPDDLILMLRRWIRPAVTMGA
jgi:CheY-like chemotaxis protein